MHYVMSRKVLSKIEIYLCFFVHDLVRIDEDIFVLFCIWIYRCVWFMMNTEMVGGVENIKEIY